MKRPCLIAGIVPALLLTGCELRQRMYDQPKMEPLEATDFFGDGRSARPLVEGTVARGLLKEDDKLYRGAGEALPPFEMTLADLERGRERYDIHCAVCHGVTGYGDGMVVKRGYKQPPSLHAERLRLVPVGYFFNTVNNGFGVMQPYADQIPDVKDRWRIAAYVRALQMSQNHSVEDLEQFAEDTRPVAHHEDGHPQPEGGK